MTKAQLEEKYGVRIEREEYFLNLYKIYSADGCPWEKGLKTIKDCEKECKRWEKELLAIKEDIYERAKSRR